MNPIEHIWDFVKLVISNRINRFIILQELTLATQEEWNHIPVDTRPPLLFPCTGELTSYYRTEEDTPLKVNSAHLNNKIKFTLQYTSLFIIIVSHFNNHRRVQEFWRCVHRTALHQFKCRKEFLKYYHFSSESHDKAQTNNMKKKNVFLSFKIVDNFDFMSTSQL